MQVSNAKVTVRPAAEEDLGKLNDIYNRYVLETHFTFDFDPMTMEERREWFAQHGTSGRYRVVVGVSDGSVIGYATTSRFRSKPGYETSVETSIYVTPEQVGRGIGTRLYEELFGFKRVAHFTEQGRKFDRYWDVGWYEKPLGGS